MLLSFKNTFFILFISILTSSVYAQKARIKGVILNDSNQPIENVSVISSNQSTKTNKNGFYILEIESDKVVVVTFSHFNFKM